MKKIMIAAALVATSLSALPPASHATDVDVSISIGQPGYYGRIDIGDFGRPQVIYREPRIVQRVVVHREPIYLHVPPGHAKNWRKHCGKYNACGERVYFVRDDWYNSQYVPRYQAMHRDRHEDRHDGKHGGNGKGKHGHGNKH